MDDFFRTLYEAALNSGALNHSNRSEYRRAITRMEMLADEYGGKAAQEELINAVYAILFQSDLDTLAYGFRLGVRVTAPDRL